LDWEWNEDPRFEAFMYDQLDSFENVLEITDITHVYLQAYTDKIFTKSDENTEIVPIFLFGLPDDYLFYDDSFGFPFQGASYDDNKRSATYIIMAANDFNYDTKMAIGESRSTIITMHEIGHHLGLLHPFDAMVWIGTQGNSIPVLAQNWLWDFTYTQMSYLGAYPEIAKMDIDTLMRGEIIIYLEKIIDKLETNYQLLQNRTSIELVNQYNYVVESVSTSIQEYQDYSTIDNYNISLSLVFDGFQGLDNFTSLYSQLEDKENFLTSNINIGLIVGSTVALFFGIYVYLIKRRKQIL
jgi:hypothetical protein